jgi:glycosyltransferase involved in cell wall biosynthesis
MLDERSLKAAELKRPLVSIIVTNYNYEKYIIPCLRSVARQSYPQYQCVVVDDASEDASVTLIEEFIRSGESRQRISLVRHERNMGQMAAFQTGLRRTEGVFVVFVDADDLLFDDFLESHVRVHLESVPVAFTCSNHYQINENDEVISGGFSRWPAENVIRPIRPRPLHHSFWVWTSTSSMMFRRTILDLIMPDDGEDFRVCADNYICHFANLIGASILIGAAHGCYRRHGSNFFSSNPVIGGRLPTGNLKKHPGHRVLRQSLLSHLLANYGKFSLLLTPRTLFRTLSYLAGPTDVTWIKKTYPGYFADKSLFFTPGLMMRGFFLKTRESFRRFCGFKKEDSE